MDFPTSLEEAVQFEQTVFPINLIINFECEEENCFKRLHSSQLSNYTIETYKKENESISNNIKLIIDFYSKFNIIKSIDCNNSIEMITKQIKHLIYPTIYSIIGKRYSGKTELSKFLNKMLDIYLINFDDFLKEPHILKKKEDNNYVCQNFIKKLISIHKQKILIENFPQNKEQYSYFNNNYKGFEKIYYLNCDNDKCLQRITKIDINDDNYIPCYELNQKLYEFENNINFIKFLKENDNFVEIDTNNYKNITFDKIMSKIQPYCIIIKCKHELDNFKNSFMYELTNKYNFMIIDINKIIENAVKRKINNLNNDNINVEDKIKLIRPILFQESYKYFILENFPINIEELNLFEKNLCKINKLIYISNDKVLNEINNSLSIEVYFKNQGKFTIISPDNISDDYIKESIDQVRDINIVYGLPQSGKSYVAKYLKNKCRFQLLDFKNFIEDIKKRKIENENLDSEPEISIEDIIKELKNYLLSTPITTKIIIDNFFVPEEGYLLNSLDNASKILNTIGKFRKFYNIFCDENILLSRYKVKEGIGEEVNEEQMNNFKESLDKSNKLIEEIKKLSISILPINILGSENKSINLLNLALDKNIIIIKHDYNINIEKILQKFAARNKVLYINVPKLIYNHFALNDEFSKKLEENYSKKNFKNPITDKSNLEGYIYYKYNPINFELSIVNEVLLTYINDHYKEIENNGNYIIITGYLNYDLLKENEIPFNLPLLEIDNIMLLGELTTFIDITTENINKEEKEEAIKLVIEKKKKIKIIDPLDVDGDLEGEEEIIKEQDLEIENNNDEKPQFNPEGFSWTNYDGKPRNYVQILKRLKQWPITEENANSIENLDKILDSFLSSHIKNYNLSKLQKYEKIMASEKDDIAKNKNNEEQNKKSNECENSKWTDTKPPGTNLIKEDISKNICDNYNGEIKIILLSKNISAKEKTKIVNFNFNGTNIKLSVLSDKITIGAGGFNLVKRIKINYYLPYISDKKIIQNQAIKQPRDSVSHSFQSFQNFFREVGMTIGLFHRNIVKTAPVYPSFPGMAMEYYDGGDLQKLIDSKFSLLTEKFKIYSLIHIVNGIKYLHDHNTIHNDLKPGNILLTKAEGIEGKTEDYPTLKITDYNLSEKGALKARGYTPHYVPPEFKTSGICTEKSDIYSFGVIILKLFNNVTKMPEDNSVKDLMPDKIREIYNSCVKINPEERCSINWIYNELINYCKSLKYDDILETIKEQKLTDNYQYNLKVLKEIYEMKQKYHDNNKKYFDKFRECKLLKITYPNGYIYTGEVKNGYWDGCGYLKNEKECISYEGFFKNGLLEGYGEMKYWSKKITVFSKKIQLGDSINYRCEYKNGYCNGIGEFTGPEGVVFQGEFENGVHKGVANVIYAHGEKFAGEHINDKKNGYGIFQYGDNSVYQGRFVAARFDGVGKLYTVKIKNNDLQESNNYLDNREINIDWVENIEFDDDKDPKKKEKIKEVYFGKWEKQIPLEKSAYNYIGDKN